MPYVTSALVQPSTATPFAARIEAAIVFRSGAEILRIGRLSAYCCPELSDQLERIVEFEVVDALANRPDGFRKRRVHFQLFDLLD